MFQYQSLLLRSESALRRMQTLALVNIVRNVRVLCFFGPTHTKEATKIHYQHSRGKLKMPAFCRARRNFAISGRCAAPHATPAGFLDDLIRRRAPTAGVGLANYLRPWLNHLSPGHGQAFFYRRVSKPIAEHMVR